MRRPEMFDLTSETSNLSVNTHSRINVIITKRAVDFNDRLSPQLNKGWIGNKNCGNTANS
jgi:hypothetical protein